MSQWIIFVCSHAQTSFRVMSNNWISPGPNLSNVVIRRSSGEFGAKDFKWGTIRGSSGPSSEPESEALQRLSLAREEHLFRARKFTAFMRLGKELYIIQLLSWALFQNISCWSPPTVGVALQRGEKRDFEFFVSHPVEARGTLRMGDVRRLEIDFSCPAAKKSSRGKRDLYSPRAFDHFASEFPSVLTRHGKSSTYGTRPRTR